jgi:hypothetical protein
MDEILQEAEMPSLIGHGIRAQMGPDFSDYAKELRFLKSAVLPSGASAFREGKVFDFIQALLPKTRFRLVGSARSYAQVSASDRRIRLDQYPKSGRPPSGLK